MAVAQEEADREAPSTNGLFSSRSTASEEFLSAYASGVMKRSDSNISLNIGLDGSEDVFGLPGIEMNQDDLEQDAAIFRVVG